MDRGDRILLWAFGMALAAIAVCCLLQQFPVAGRTFWALVWSPEASGWAQALGTVGAIIAAIRIATADRHERVKREQAIAAMRVASKLRSWLGPCASSLADVATYMASGGTDGSDALRIPEFNIDPNDVALLPLTRAKRVYSIMEQRSRAIDAVGGELYYGPWIDGAVTFQKESAKLFRRARKLYREMAEELGLYPWTCQAWELRVVNDAARAGGVQGWKDLVGKRTDRS